MVRGDKRWIAALGVAALCAAAAAFFFFRRDDSPSSQSGEQSSSDPSSRWRGFPAGQPSFPSDAGSGVDGTAPAVPGSGDPPVEKQIETIMGSWRHSILNKDADTVISLDRVFAAEREKFMTSLITSAETDSEE